MSDPVPSRQLTANHRTLGLAGPVVMGVLNVTPDSFSDGGAHTDREVETGLRMLEEGAAIVDVGGESTRPGADPVAVDAELARVIPVIEALRAETEAWLSVDTSKPEVMRAAVAAGADLINDVRAMQAAGAMEAVAESGAAVCLMHMQGEPRVMQDAPHYDDVVAEVEQFLLSRAGDCEAAGLDRSRICIDPGIGFGKTLEHNLTLLAATDRLVASGYPVVIGVSRKSMFKQLLDRDVQDRLPASLAAGLHAVAAGARILRVHDVRETMDALRVAAAIGASEASGEV
jgi:dihydropteroate synthase